MPKKAERLVPMAFRVSPALCQRIKEFLLEYKGKPHFITSHAYAETSLELGLQHLEAKFQAEDEGKSPVIRRLNDVAVLPGTRRI